MTDFINPTDPDNLARLALASPFAHQLWQGQSAQDFVSKYPLTQFLGDDIIAQEVAACLVYDDDGLPDEAALMANLRRLRNHLMMRWIYQDALMLIDVMVLTKELSAFANHAICLAKECVYQRLCARFGVPTISTKSGKIADELAIIAMGKLGASELNLSSDIDLIFIHKGAGETDGKKIIDNQKFMIQLGRGVIKIIDEITADGFVFRVDMRLRPWGDGSPLVMTVSALEKYFNKHGRTWERFAWLKARVINPIDAKFYGQIDSIKKNFIFRYYVDYTAFAALREMRVLIANQVAQREDLDNVKLGVGGIRDIEFIAQSFALIYGGHYAVLTEKTACLEALSALCELQLLDKKTTDELTCAYRFLRRLEHAIQARHDTQTQKLPKGEELTAIARTLGFDDSAQLINELNHHRKKVSYPFDKLVTDRQTTTYVSDGNESKKLDEFISQDNRDRLTNFWQSKLVKESSTEAKQRLDAAYPMIISALVQLFEAGIDANEAILPLINLLESIAKRSVYLVMLAENPNSLKDLLIMLQTSPWVANELARYPVLLDTFLQKRYTHLPDKAELMYILQQNLASVPFGDDESFLMSIRLFKKTQVLAVACSDVLQHHPIMKVSDSLTFISEVVLEACLYRAFDELSKKHGMPVGVDGAIDEQNIGFGIVGYGKLGGIEMSYASDLDVVFLHRIDERADTLASDGQSAISGMKFATRLVQKLINYLTTQTRDGRAYELDMRLRPSGNAGVMVVSVQGYETYQHDKAWAWEHQALVRARAICGDKAVLDKFNAIRLDVLTLPRDTAVVRQDVLAMRQKMREHLSNDKSDKFHLKQDAGGLIDIEFLAQFAVLAYAHDKPKLAVWSDNIRIFESVAAEGVWQESVCQSLADSYLIIRKATHEQALHEKKSIVDNDKWQALRHQIIAIWQEILQGGN